MAAEVPLQRLQRWLQAVVVHPGTAQEAVAARAARLLVPPRRLHEVVLPSATLRPDERVAIYHGMYLLRMEEALASDYPALKHFLGDEGFRRLVAAYVRAHPSRSYSLNFLGRHLPDFVGRARGLRQRAFCQDLARLELAAAQVFDAPEEPALTPEQVAAVPDEAWRRARLVPIAGFRLLSFRYPVSAYARSVREDDHAHPAARARDSWAVVYRRAYGVVRQDLDRAGHALLSDIASGKRLGRAVGAALRRGRGRRPDEATLFRWFRDWVGAGMFRAIDVG